MRFWSGAKSLPSTKNPVEGKTVSHIPAPLEACLTEQGWNGGRSRQEKEKQGRLPGGGDFCAKLRKIGIGTGRDGEGKAGLVAGLQKNAKLCFCHRLFFPLIHQPLRHQIFKRTGRPGSSSMAS